jgi:hypothetical protein
MAAGLHSTPEIPTYAPEPVDPYPNGHDALSLFPFDTHTGRDSRHN